MIRRRLSVFKSKRDRSYLAFRGSRSSRAYKIGLQKVTIDRKKDERKRVDRSYAKYKSSDEFATAIMSFAPFLYIISFSDFLIGSCPHFFLLFPLSVFFFFSSMTSVLVLRFHSSLILPRERIKDT